MVLGGQAKRTQAQEIQGRNIGTLPIERLNRTCPRNVFKRFQKLNFYLEEDQRGDLWV